MQGIIIKHKNIRVCLEKILIVYSRVFAISCSFIIIFVSEKKITVINKVYMYEQAIFFVNSILIWKNL